MMIETLSLAVGLALQNVEPSVETAETETVTTETRILDIPPEIAPVIFPYVACLTGSKGVPMRNEKGEIISNIEKGTDCAPYRARVVSDSHRALKRAGYRSPDERDAIIAKTLSSVETAMEPPAASDVLKSPENAENK